MGFGIIGGDIGLFDILKPDLNSQVYADDVIFLTGHSVAEITHHIMSVWSAEQAYPVADLIF